MKGEARVSSRSAAVKAQIGSADALRVHQHEEEKRARRSKRDDARDRERVLTDTLQASLAAEELGATTLVKLSAQTRTRVCTAIVIMRGR